MAQLGTSQRQLFADRSSTDSVQSPETPADDRDHHRHAERWPDLRTLLHRTGRRLCTRRLLLDRLPIVRFARTYELGFLYQDFMAGLTVGLTAIPQGIAYAVVAGLAPQYGLYSELLASFVYCVLGSSRNVTIGPTAIMALMVQRFALLSADFAVFASFACGLIIIALGVLNMGSLVQFISIPVTAGFTTAAALQIGSLQVKSLLGIPGRSTEFLDAWRHVLQHLDEVRLWDAVLGVATVAFLLAFKKMGDIRRGRYAATFKYLALARNALAVFIGSLIAFALTRSGQPAPFALTGEIKAGFPPFQMPPFETTVANRTVGLGEMLGTMGSSLAAIPFIAILEIIVVAKAFSQGRSIDATQEIIALGFCNLLGSFVSSMPVTGSFTRTAVNSASGCRTPFGGIVTGVLVLLSIGFLTDTFRFIPKATLAAIIITAMCFMMEFDTGYKIWRTRRLDVIPFVATMLACLIIGLDYGIVLGIVVNMAFVLYATARPQCDVRHTKVASQSVLVIVLDQSLVFSAAEHLRHKVLKYASHDPATAQAAASYGANTTTTTTTTISIGSTERPPANGDVAAVLPTHHIHAAGHKHPDQGAVDDAPPSVVVLDGRSVRTIDMTVAQHLQLLTADLKARNQTLFFWNWPQQPTDVAWRFGRTLGERFYRSETLPELMDQANVNCFLR